MTIVVKDCATGKSYKFETDSIVVGSDASCDLVVPDPKLMTYLEKRNIGHLVAYTVGARHARIHLRKIKNLDGEPCAWLYVADLKGGRTELSVYNDGLIADRRVPINEGAETHLQYGMGRIVVGGYMLCVELETDMLIV